MDLEANNKSFYESKELNANTKICRYMDFDTFLQILDGKFYVPRKLCFLDSRESGKLPLKAYCIYPHMSVEEIKTKIGTYTNNLKKSRLLLTSCWTIDKGEDYLMWKSYTSRIGVCLQTTIGKLNDAINFKVERKKNEEETRFAVICAKIDYGNISTNQEFLPSMFTKESFYRSENEVRYYFVPESNIPNNNLKNDSSTEDMNKTVEETLFNTITNEEKMYNKDSKNYEIFDIDAQKLIKSVILSPFIHPYTSSIFRTLLENQYPKIFNKGGGVIKFSELSLNN